MDSADSTPEPLPRLRPLEILRLPQDGAESFVLRDPEGYTDEELVLSEAALFVAAHADGVHTREDVQAGFARRYGSPPPEGQVDALFRRLDEAHMLETEAFAAHREGLREAFRRAPVRAAAHAAVSYPADPGEADGQITDFFSKADALEEDGPRPGGTLRGIVAPHIDLRVGGACTALAYRLLEAAPAAETVVVLGTAHACPHPAWIVADKPFETPLGTVPVDAEACARLAAAAGPGDLYYHRREHSIEFQALFLAKLREGGRPLKLVPVLCGSLRPAAAAQTDTASEPEAAPPDAGGSRSAGTSPGTASADAPGAPVQPPDPNVPFLAALREYLAGAGERAVVVAAADLAHVGVRFGDPEPLSAEHLGLLEKKDRATLSAVAAGDAAAFFGSVMEAGDPRRICGLSPIFAMLSALPGGRGKLLRYEQAVDPTGTVSYASLGLWDGAGDAR